MSNKRIQVATAQGGPWYTLPGSTGSRKAEATMVKDTIFGQPYDSEFPALLAGTITGNSVFKGLAGYQATIKKTGTPTVMTAEACTLVTGKTYQITNAAHQLIDYNTTVHVSDNGVDQTANVASVDYLSGTIVFESAYAPTGPVTITGKYLPKVVVANAKKITVTQTQTELDPTSYDTAQAAGGYKTTTPGLKTVKLEVGGVYNQTNGWFAALNAGSFMYFETDLEGATNPGMEIFRGMFYASSQDVSGAQGALEEESIQFSLYVAPGELVLQPFGWYFNNNTTIGPAIQNTLQAWINQSNIWVQYLPNGTPDGTSGAQFEAIVTECSLTNQVDGLNEFSFTYKQTGAVTVV
jgi:hypothetical protein